MPRQQGKSGMGAAKHRKSGHAGPAPGTKLGLCRDDNRFREDRKRRVVTPKADTVSDLLKPKKA